MRVHLSKGSMIGLGKAKEHLAAFCLGQSDFAVYALLAILGFSGCKRPPTPTIEVACDPDRSDSDDCQVLCEQKESACDQGDVNGCRAACEIDARPAKTAGGGKPPAYFKNLPLISGACRKLGDMHLMGVFGLPEDKDAAAKLYRRACNDSASLEGHLACARLTAMELAGEAPVNVRDRFEETWRLRLLCQANRQQACDLLVSKPGSR